MVFFLGSSTKECYENKYKEILFGNSEKGINGFPILAYLESNEPSDEEIIAALRRLKTNAINRQNDLEKDYYKKNSENQLIIDENSIEDGLDDIAPLFAYKAATDAIRRKNRDDDKINDLILKGEDELEWDELKSMGITIGVIFGGIIACEVFAKRLLINGLCKSIFGLGANAYFVWHDDNEFSKSLEEVLFHPDGYKMLGSIDRLDNKNLARMISILTMPIGTGLPEIGKALRLKEVIKQKWKALKAFLKSPDTTNLSPSH